jgi:hypothetical protein
MQPIIRVFGFTPNVLNQQIVVNKRGSKLCSAETQLNREKTKGLQA